MTIREALAQTGAELKAAGIDTPSLDASLLLAHILNTNRTALAAMGSDPLSEESFATLRALAERRKKGECIAYILGKKEFRGLEFLVNPSVLVPRPDTETLVEAALEILGNNFHSFKEKKPRSTRSYTEFLIGNSLLPPCNSVTSAVLNSSILDLCTGSGAVAISLKNEMPSLEVWASDISDEALETAKKNAALLLPACSIKFLHGDLYNALPIPHSPFLTPSFSLIVCNPPYIPTDEMQGLPAEVRKEPRLALDGGLEGLAVIKRVIDGSVEKLMHGGALLLEADPRQMEKITFFLEKQGFSNIKLYKDLSGKERVIGGIYE